MTPQNIENIEAKLRELEIRIVGVDGNNGLTKQMQDLEVDVKEGFKQLMEKLQQTAEDRDKRLHELELRMYLIWGVPAIAGGTIAFLKFLNILT
jgi:hypothetical protein